jgi:Mannosyltransferase OCH1 and related enzymes
MQICDCNYYEFEKIKNKKIIIFGIGAYFNYYVSESFPNSLVKNVAYFVDNNPSDSTIQIWGRVFSIYNPEILKSENNCIVILASTNHINSMYNQLNKMHLNSSITCYVYPFILINTIGNSEKSRIKSYFSNYKMPKIPKRIHCFWFSGDPKPEEYQKCKNSWKKYCPDYNIYEWNMDNYDYKKNNFMKKAIDSKKWAFASDFARLDILYKCGGIYLDMDVEIIKPLDDLLNSNAFFTFDTNMDIDLGTFASQPENTLVKDLMKIYENINFSSDLNIMNWFCQPRYIRPVLKKYGVKLDGTLQIINNMIFFPRSYLAPKDSIIYELNALSQNTYAIHHYNAGWKSNNYRSMRIQNNRIIWNIFKNTENIF